MKRVTKGRNYCLAPLYTFFLYGEVVSFLEDVILSAYTTDCSNIANFYIKEPNAECHFVKVDNQSVKMKVTNGVFYPCRLYSF